MGFSIVNVIDPINNEQVSIISQFQYLVAVLIFLLMNGHHIFLYAIGESFRIIPPLGFHFSGELMQLLLGFVKNMLEVAIKTGAPIIAVLMFMSVGMGLVARTVPQINIFIVGFPLQIAIGLIGIGLTLPVFLRVVEDYFSNLEGEIILTSPSHSLNEDSFLTGVSSNLQETCLTRDLIDILRSRRERQRRDKAMADNDKDQEKTEQATPRRREEARKKGQVAKSQELASVAILLACLTYFNFDSARLLKKMMGNLSGFLRSSGTLLINTDNIQSLAVELDLRILYPDRTASSDCLCRGTPSQFRSSGIPISAGGNRTKILQDRSFYRFSETAFH